MAVQHCGLCEGQHPCPAFHSAQQSPLAVTADKTYDSEKVRQQIKDEGALPIIPSRSNANRKAYCPKRFYRRRHTIEKYFCGIKDWRRIATRYDNATTLVGALYWIKLWVQTLVADQT